MEYCLKMSNDKKSDKNYKMWLNEIESPFENETNIFEPVIFAQGKMALNIIQYITLDTFVDDIMVALQRMHVKTIMDIQKYAWAHILRGNSLFIVNPPQTGKTWCYLPCICSLFLYRLRKSIQSGISGPIVIIIVTSKMRGEYILKDIKCLLQAWEGNASAMVVPLLETYTNMKAKIQDLHSCGILIITLDNLTRLIEQNKFFTNMGRLQHIVIDDIDLMLHRFSRRNFETMLETVGSLFNFNKNNLPRIQLIVTSSEWHQSLLMPLIHKANDPLLLFGDFLEAAVYGRSALTLKVSITENKIDIIIRFFESEKALEGRRRIIIVCNTKDEVDYVETLLLKSGIYCFCYTNHADIEMLANVDDWKSLVLGSILICTDNVLAELRINNVHYLIHYSLPSNWIQFKQRFALFTNVFPNFMNNAQLSKFEQVESLLLLDEENDSILPNLINFLRCHSLAVDPQILRMAEKLDLKNEESRIQQDIPICKYFLEFGICQEESHCTYRHALSKEVAKVPNDEYPIQNSGDLLVHILKVYSPTHFAVSLQKYKPPNASQWIECNNDAALFDKSIQLHYSNPFNWVVHWPLNINDICILRQMNKFKRVRILYTRKANKEIDVSHTSQVAVQLLDNCIDMITVCSDDLLTCDERFRSKPPFAIDVQLSCSLPTNNEQNTYIQK